MDRVESLTKRYLTQLFMILGWVIAFTLSAEQPADDWNFPSGAKVKLEHQALKQPNHAYRLTIGDRLLISVYGELNTDREVVVDGSGEITYPVAGTIMAAGMTIDQLKAEINRKIGSFFRYAFVSITPIEYGGQNYTILGQVLAPGRKVIMGQETVLSALCRAGGFPVGQYRATDIDLADLEHAFLMRKGDYVPVDFKALVYDGDLSENVQLEGGDYIFIPSSLDREIFVLGEVIAPGPMSFVNTVTLVEAITQAGGLGINASSRVMVVRGSLAEPYTFYIDIMRIFKGCACDFRLQPGDIVYVPPRQFTYLRGLLRSAIQTFVSNFASQAGVSAFESAFQTNATIQPVNLIPSGTIAPVIVVPTTP